MADLASILKTGESKSAFICDVRAIAAGKSDPNPTNCGHDSETYASYLADHPKLTKEEHLEQAEQMFKAVLEQVAFN